MPSFLMNNNKKTVHFANFCWKKLGDFFLFVNYFCFPFFCFIACIWPNIVWFLVSDSGCLRAKRSYACQRVWCQQQTKRILKLVAFFYPKNHTFCAVKSYEYKVEKSVIVIFEAVRIHIDLIWLTAGFDFAIQSKLGITKQYESQWDLI